MTIDAAMREVQRQHDTLVALQREERARCQRRERQVRTLIESAHEPRVPQSDAELRSLLEQSIEIAKERKCQSL